MRVSFGSLPFSGSTSLTLTGSATYFSDPFKLQHMEGMSAQLVLSGNCNGTASVQVSNDEGALWKIGGLSRPYISRTYDVVNWGTITQPTTTVQTFSGAGTVNYNIPLINWQWARIKIVASDVLNATGSLTANVGAKGPS